MTHLVHRANLVLKQQVNVNVSKVEVVLNAINVRRLTSTFLLVIRVTVTCPVQLVSLVIQRQATVNVIQTLQETSAINALLIYSTTHTVRNAVAIQTVHHLCFQAVKTYVTRIQLFVRVRLTSLVVSVMSVKTLITNWKILIPKAAQCVIAIERVH